MSDYRFGYVKNPTAVRRITREWEARYGYHPHIAQCAPGLLQDGQTGDILNYMAYYETEIPGWKPKDQEPPYPAQPGNDCTAESTSRGYDLLQMIEMADPIGVDMPNFRGPQDRACIEATYAYGLSAAGMRGDQGCYGAGIAQGSQQNGVLSYADAGQPYEVNSARLRQWANSPSWVVKNYATKSRPFKCEIVKITTWADACAWWANRGVVTIASDVGFEDSQGGPGLRDQSGICPARGKWPHQMVSIGCIRSDGTETAVIVQSWGPNVPKGPQPFRLPSYCFRVVRSDYERILGQDDCWGYRAFAGFARTPVPTRWTYDMMA